MTRRIFESFDIKGGWLLSVILMVLSSVLLLFGSLFIYRFVVSSVETQNGLDFKKLVDTHSDKMADDLGVVVNFLYDLRGHLAMSNMNDATWSEYIKTSGFNIRYGNNFSIAYVEKVDRANLDAYVSQLKKSSVENFSYKNYVVFPTTGNKDVYPIKFLSTFDNDIVSLLGFDFGSSESLSQTMLEVSLSGKEQISPLLFFNKVISGSSKTGYVVMLPVFSNPNALELSPEERRKFIIGFVGAFVQPETLFLGLGIEDKNLMNISFIVKDGGTVVYKYQDSLEKGGQKISREVSLLGKKFDFEFSDINSYNTPSFLDNFTWKTLIGLITLNIFWYLTIFALILARVRSQRITKEAVSDLIKFKQAVDGVSDLVTISDPSGKILYINDAATKTTGYFREEIIGNNPSLWGKQMDKTFYENFWKTIKIEKKPFAGELRNKRKSGEIYDVDIRVWPILDEKGEVVFYVGIEKDISKVKGMDRMKTEFISLASHQLRTPLSAVKWFGKMLFDGDAGDLTKVQKEYLSKINESNEREIQLINALLSVSRIDSGKIIIEPKSTDIKALVDSVVKDVQLDVNGTDRRIKLTFDETIPSIMVDPDMIRHVYLNLINNAVSYTTVNGKIDIDIRVKDGELITKISDDGIGIPLEEQDRVFEKFFRATNALKKETDGSGLGLYLAKTIVESSGGRIWFNSKENLGTTFWFSLPIIV